MMLNLIIHIRTVLRIISRLESLVEGLQNVHDEALGISDGPLARAIHSVWIESTELEEDLRSL